jgi:hypothetical protein
MSKLQWRVITYLMWHQNTLLILNHYQTEPLFALGLRTKKCQGPGGAEGPVPNFSSPIKFRNKVTHIHSLINVQWQATVPPRQSSRFHNVTTRQLADFNTSKEAGAGICQVCLHLAEGMPD